MAEMIYTQDGGTPVQRRKAAELLALYPDCARIVFARPPAGRVKPADDEIIYVMAGHGASGRAARLLVGAALAASRKARQAAETAARRQADAERAYPEWAEIVRTWQGKYYQPHFRPDFMGRLVPAVTERTEDGAAFVNIYDTIPPPSASSLAEKERKAAEWWARYRCGA